MRVLAVVALCLPLGAAVAVAQPGPVSAGAQAAPPVHSGEPKLDQQLDARRNVRGCAVGETCVRPSDELREIDAELFPNPARAGQSPWLDERTPPGSRIEKVAPKKALRPSELRADAAWMDTLAMPDLPVTWTPKLVEYLLFYKQDPRGRAIMASWLAAAGRYRELIVAHLRAAHLPEDLLYDAMIESSFDPDDSSSAGALGLWQFMPEGGRIYGLREDRWVDERRDPLRSTIAVLDYWKDLYQRFGDWQIALAAFNVGYGAMLRSVARYNTNDYYQLCEYENGLPWETCLYTPKVLAAAIVGKNRAAFGYDTVVEQPAEAWDDVTVPTSVSLAVIARAAGANEADIKRLNPQLRRGRTPPNETAYVVRVPAASKPEFVRKLVEMQTEWDGYDAYVVAHGERFEDIATTFGISLAQLKKLNDVRDVGEIEGGAVLVVPRITEAQRAKNQAKAKAALLGSGVDQKEGEQLIVALPDKDAVVAGKKRVFYRVVPSDTLRGVSKALGVKSADLVAWNAIDADVKLQPKMVLVAWVAPDFDAAAHKVSLLDEADLAIVTRGSPEHLDLAEARMGRVRSEYTSPGKEKLADVAKRFGMGSHDLARINRISYDTTLDKGQTIIVYEVADPKRSARAGEQWKKTPTSRRGKLSPTRTDRTANATTDDDAKAKSDAKANDEPTKSDAAKHDGPASSPGPVMRPSQLE